jgi:hypothetical protein
MKRDELLELVEQHLSMVGAAGELARAFHRAYSVLVAIDSYNVSKGIDDGYLTQLIRFGMFEIDEIPNAISSCSVPMSPTC